MNESGWISLVSRHPLARVPEGWTGIGDDAAVLPLGEGRYLLLSTDTLIDGVDFVLARDGAAAVGYKALAANLSDLAAMGGKPTGFLLTVAAPRGWDETAGRALLDGMLPLAERYQCPLLGGDTSSTPGPFTVSITVVGENFGAPVHFRGGARPGDLLYVTGPLGGSLLGKQFCFRPRLDEARLAGQKLPVTALLDISDGLARDASRLAEASGAGVLLREDAIPISRDAEVLSRRSGRPPLEHALGDGEDFELLLAIRPEGRTIVENTVWPEYPPFLVGEVFAGEGLWLLNREGTRVALAATGYEHAF